MDTSNPLVSIIVITYNSSKYIVETLESAKNQTYTNIELIISDDNSKDDSVFSYENCIKQKSLRFNNFLFKIFFTTLYINVKIFSGVFFITTSIYSFNRVNKLIDLKSLIKI